MSWIKQGFAAAVLCWVLGSPPALAQGGVMTEAKAWGALVYAGDGGVEGLGPGVSKQFGAVEGQLKKLFKTERLVLLAEHIQEIFKEYESWVVPSKELYLKVDSRGPVEGGGTQLGLQVWQGSKVLVKTDAVLVKDKPLIIGGPAWRGGRLIFVVVLQ